MSDWIPVRWNSGRTSLIRADREITSWNNRYYRRVANALAEQVERGGFATGRHSHRASVPYKNIRGLPLRVTEGLLRSPSTALAPASAAASRRVFLPRRARRRGSCRPAHPTSAAP